MQKLAATSKINYIDTTTAFMSHMFDWLLKNDMIKWNTLIISKHKHSNT